jgi:hypothetical protein
MMQTISRIQYGRKKKVLTRALKKKAEDTDLHGANYQK